MVHHFVVAGYVTSYGVFSTVFVFASLLKSFSSIVNEIFVYANKN